MSLTQYITGAINQMMCMDGTTAVLDAIHGALAFTKTGGVGNTWPGDASNFRTILGAQAPVIAKECTNKLSAEYASFEGGSVGGYGVNDGTGANSTAQAYTGTHSLLLTVTGADPFLERDITAYSDNAEHTASANFKGIVGKQYQVWLRGDVSGISFGTSVVADGTWQTTKVTHTWTTDTIRYIRLVAVDGAVGNTVYWDAIQLESGTQTPFALPGSTPSRTACAMSIPTATIGLATGEPFSIVCGFNLPVTTTMSGIEMLFDIGDGSANRIYCYMTSALIYFAIKDNAGNAKDARIVLDAGNFAPNIDHVAICTADSANTLQLFWDGVASTTFAGATARESSMPANFYAGTDFVGNNHINGAMLPAAYGRVLAPTEAIDISSRLLAGTLTWPNFIELPQITVTGLATGNAVRLYDAAGNIHASAVETGGTATLTYTLD